MYPFILGSSHIAYSDSKFQPFTTIRHNECELLLSESATAKSCSKCEAYRKTLHAMASRYHKQQKACDDKTSPRSHTNYRFLSPVEKAQRLYRMHNAIHASKKQVQKLKARIAEISERRAAQVSKEMHDDLSKIMWENVSQIGKEYPAESFPRLFWEQQMKAASVKDARAMRWHPLMVKWCLYLQHKSSGAYELMRESGVIKLPSQRTLKDYTHYIQATPGFSPKVDQQLMEAAEIATCPEFKKYVFLLLDEMHVKEDLVYDKHTGMFVGEKTYCMWL